MLEAGERGQGAWEWLHPQPLPAHGPAQPQTPSISCLWLWPPTINRGSESIFFQNKHQTVTTGPESTPRLGQCSLPQPLCPTLPHPLPQPAGTGAPGGQRGTGSKPRGKTSWRGRAGASLSGATPPGWVSQGTRPLLPGQAFPPFATSHHQSCP